MGHQNDDVSEPWEALDVDDSDLPFLRPCSTRRLNPSLPPPRPQIPGPAGAVQAAMRRRSQNHRTLCSGGEDDSITTQEYVRRVLENGGDCGDDGDFAANPWLCALEFLRTRSLVDGNCTASGAPLSSIKNGIYGDRVALVVAIIKSCTPTGLGDLMVTLKDPTGTLGASIHRKVLSEGEYGKSISVGAVLVLQKVAVFAPLRSGYYLNVTLGNVIKVIPKDSGPPSNQSHSLSSVRYAIERGKMTDMPQASTSPLKTRGIMNDLRKSSELSGSLYCNRVTEENAVPENLRNPVANPEKQITKQVTMNEIMEVTISGSKNINANDEQCSLSKPDEGDDSSSCSIRATNASPNPKFEISFGTEKQKPIPVSRTTIPDWTDEELEQLGAFDD